jgi:hypothetical protein
MELLFQTTGNTGNSELKDLLGFIDADLKLKNMLPDIITATNEIIDIIGLDVYNKALDLYSNGETIEEDKPFIYAVRYPIAVNAYRLYSPSNDLAHTNNGRKMRQDDNEKQAFQWMLDADNAALEKRYYRAIDDLIKFLDRSKVSNETLTTLYTIWTSSDAFKATQKLFIRTVSEFDDHFPINSRLLLLKLAPGIYKCEQYEILPRIGKEKFTALKTALKENTPINESKDLELIRLIREASVAYSLSWAMPRLSVQLYPEGVLQMVTSEQATTKGAKPPMMSETEAARQAFTNDANRAFIEIEKLLAPPLTIDETAVLLPEQKFGDKFFSA